MRAILRRQLVLVITCVLAVGIISAGAVDHRGKQVRAERVEVSEWYCIHLAERCNGPSSASIEDRWNTRETLYAATLVALAAFALGKIAFGRSAHLRSRASPLSRNSS